MRRRADERDGTVPETVKGGKVASKWAQNLVDAIEATLAAPPSAVTTRLVGRSTARL